MPAPAPASQGAYASPPVDPLAATMAAPGELGDADEEEAVTALMDAPSEQQALYDADAEESDSSVSAEPQPAPLPAAGRPARQEAAMRGGPLAGIRNAPAAGANSPTARARGGRARPPQVVVEHADEHTVPAMRYVQQINTRRTSMLVAVSIAFVVSLAAIVALLLFR